MLPSKDTNGTSTPYSGLADGVLHVCYYSYCILISEVSDLSFFQAF